MYFDLSRDAQNRGAIADRIKRVYVERVGDETGRS